MFLQDTRSTDVQDEKSRFASALVQMGVRSVRVNAAREQPSASVQRGLISATELEKVLVGQSQIRTQ